MLYFSDLEIHEDRMKGQTQIFSSDLESVVG